MADGLVLLNFIDNQKDSKISIAKGLGISRRTLYQYFDSQTLTPETKKKFEDYFNTKIFTESAYKEAELEAKQLDEGATLYPKVVTGVESNNLTELKATVDLLTSYVLKLQAKVYNRPIDELIDEYGEDFALQIQKLKKK